MSFKWTDMGHDWPPEGVEVLAYYGDDPTPSIVMDCMVDSCWEVYAEEDSRPTHWMYLPEPPEAE